MQQELTENRENEALNTELSIDELDYHLLKKEKTERTIRMHQFKRRMKKNLFSSLGVRDDASSKSRKTGGSEAKSEGIY